MSDERIIRANFAEKREVYKHIIPSAGYPLLYAVQLDLQETVATRRGVEVKGVGATNKVDPLQEYVRMSLGQQNIGTFSVPRTTTYSVRFAAELNEPSVANDINLAYTTGGERTYYDAAMQRLADAANAIYRPGSWAFNVLFKMREQMFDVDQLFVLRLMHRAVLNGLFSTFEAAVNLNQTTNRQEKASAVNANVRALLESPVLTEFTKRAQFNTVTKLGLIRAYLREQVHHDASGVTLSPHMGTFLDTVNERVSGNIHHMHCPFTAVLGDSGIAEVQDFYDHKLPDKVVEIMHVEKDRSGISTAGSIVSRVLNNLHV